MSEPFTPSSHTLRSVYIDARMAWCSLEDHVRAKRRREVAAEFDRWLDRERAAARREGQAEAWEAGYTSGHSNAMRRMSDEPNVIPAPNPYRTGDQS